MGRLEAICAIRWPQSIYRQRRYRRQHFSRLHQLCEALGYGGLLLGNLFAYRSTDQSALYRVADPIGSKNDSWLKKLQEEAALVICAWSATGAYQSRNQAVLSFLHNPHCLTKLKSGHPGHPLYKRSDLQPVPYKC